MPDISTRATSRSKRPTGCRSCRCATSCLPLHDDPAPRRPDRVGRTRSTRRWRTTASLFVVTQRRPEVAEPAPARAVPHRHRRPRAPALPAARRHAAGAGRGDRPRALAELRRARRTTSPSARSRSAHERAWQERRDRGADAARLVAVQRVRAPEPPDPRRGRGRGVQHHGRRAAGRHDRRAPPRQGRGEAGDARGGHARGALRAPRRDARRASSRS